MHATAKVRCAERTHMSLATEELESYRLRLRYKIARHVGYACPDVDDLVQETLARVLRSAEGDTIHNRSNIGGFLNGVANHVIHEYRRRLWREQPYNSEVHDSRPVPSEAEHMEILQAAQVVLRQLSPRDAEILRSYYLQEKTKDEVCAELGLSDPQFRVVVFRARERFRRIYLQR